MTKKFYLCLGLVCLLTACSSKSKEATPARTETSSTVTSLTASLTTAPTSVTTSLTSQATTATSTSSERTEQNPPIKEEVIQELANGQRHLLNVPQMFQVTNNYCAPTTVAMILASRGVASDQWQLAQEMGTYDPFGTHNKDAIRVLNAHLFGYETPGPGQAGYRLETVTDVASQLATFKERLIQNTKDGYPMYYTLDLSRVYPGWTGEHNVAGAGYQLTADGKDVAYVYYIDSIRAVQDPVYGGLKKLTPEELLYATIFCQEPNYAW